MRRKMLIYFLAYLVLMAFIINTEHKQLMDNYEIKRLNKQMEEARMYIEILRCQVNQEHSHKYLTQEVIPR